MTAHLSKVESKASTIPEVLRVLIVEDDEADYLHLKGILSRSQSAERFDIVWEQNFDAAKEALTGESAYDLCLLDYRLGARDGIQLLKESGGVDAKVPFIVLTGAGSDHIDDLALDAGAADYFDKQEVTSTALSRAIRYAIRNHNMRQELKTLADEDALTGLDNPRMFKSKIGDALKRARRSDSQVALLFLDLDGFKAVNDTYGHTAGDALLREVSERLRCVMRESDLIGRFGGNVGRVGGDEFAVLLEGVKTARAVDTVARKIIYSLGKMPYKINGQPVTIGVSIGAAFYPTHATDVQTLMSVADAAMYAAKKRSGNQLVFWSDAVRAQQTPASGLRKIGLPLQQD